MGIIRFSEWGSVDNGDGDIRITAHDCNPPSEDCNHGRSLIETRKHDIFVRIAIMVAILYIPAVRIFKAITAGHSRLSSLRSAYALDMWLV